MNADGGRLPKRRHRKPRCRACGLHTEICVCAELPRVPTRQSFLLVQHAIETLRPTNTGRMVEAMLPNTKLMTYGLRVRPFDDAPLRREDTDYLLLYPSDDAVQLTRDMCEPRAGRRVEFVLLDGTWRQAAHMGRRIEALRRMPRVCLPPGGPTSWTIRNPSRSDQLCTLEAAIRVVDVAGYSEAAAAMHDALEWIEARMLFMKGRLPRPYSLAEARALALSPPPT